MSEESVPTEPPPPDIRPFGRSYPNKSNHDRAVSYSSDPIVYTAIRQYVRSHCSLSSCAWLLLAILAISAIPLASAQSTLDPYTSYPANTRSSPILDTISWLLTSAFDALSKVTGIDHVSAHNIQGLAKRLDQTGKIEAGMIPVLVALSGTFAGLTLG